MPFLSAERKWEDIKVIFLMLVFRHVSQVWFFQNMKIRDFEVGKHAKHETQKFKTAKGSA